MLHSAVFVLALTACEPAATVYGGPPPPVPVAPSEPENPLAQPSDEPLTEEREDDDEESAEEAREEARVDRASDGVVEEAPQ